MRSRNKPPAVLLLVLALALLLTSCLYGCSDKGKSPWSNGSGTDTQSASYQAGYQAGYDAGFMAGDTDNQRDRDWNGTAPVPRGDHDNDYLEGFSDGYRKGYDETFGAGQTEDGEDGEGTEEGEGLSEDLTEAMLESLPGSYQCDAWFAPNYMYELFINPDLEHYSITLRAKGLGTDLMFQEKGTCFVSPRGMTLELFPDELHENRPEEFPVNAVFKIRYEESQSGYWVKLVDADGNVWE